MEISNNATLCVQQWQVSNPELPAGSRTTLHVPTHQASSPQLREGKASLLTRAVRPWKAIFTIAAYFWFVQKDTPQNRSAVSSHSGLGNSRFISQYWEPPKPTRPSPIGEPFQKKLRKTSKSHSEALGQRHSFRQVTFSKRFNSVTSVFQTLVQFLSIKTSDTAACSIITQISAGNSLWYCSTGQLKATKWFPYGQRREPLGSSTAHWKTYSHLD